MASMDTFFPADYPDFEEFGTPPCATSDPDSFFSDEALEGMMHNRITYSHEREAKMTCMECPYAKRCLQFALDNPDVQGIWGGTTEKQRASIRRGTPISLKLPPSRHS